MAGGKKSTPRLINCASHVNTRLQLLNPGQGRSFGACLGAIDQDELPFSKRKADPTQRRM